MNAIGPTIAARRASGGGRSRARAAAALAIAAALAGCGGSLGDQFGDSVWVTPRKYAYHNCLQAQRADAGFAARQQELEELMTRAARDPGGAAIGFAVYRTEYQQVLGERKEIARQLAEKRCHAESPRSSERSLF